ncbi:MAG: SBBP repeat-containing protein [Bacteroidetes bacterium]|nr:SBBP repeat-containing protein [Bacteroidota bacterium]
MGGTLTDNALALTIDASCNVYTTGTFFCLGKSMGGASPENSRSIVVDASRQYLYNRLFYGATDFDPNGGIANLVSNGSYDIFVSKLDSSGNFIWAKNMGGVSADFGFSIAVDGVSNVYTTGTIEGTADFDEHRNN